MKTNRKIILISFIAFFLLLTPVAGAIIYYYTHPSAVKALVEKVVSDSTGTLFNIKRLTYSLSPLRVIAKGITFKSGNDPSGFHIELPYFTADLSLEGHFGQKSLLFRHLKADGFSGHISENSTIPKIEQRSKRPSFLGATLKRVIALFLFKDFKFQDAEFSHGQITAQLGDKKVHVREIHAHLNVDHLIELSCSIQIEWPSKKMNLTIPRFNLKTDRAISIADPEIKGSLTILEAVFDSSDVNIKKLGGRTDLLYQHDQKKLTFKNTDLILGEIRVQKKVQPKPLPFDLHIKTGGAINLTNNKLNTHHLYLAINEVLQLSGKLDAIFGTKKDFKLKIVDGHFFPEKLRPILPQKMRKRFEPAKLSGPVNFKGSVGGFEERNQWNWDYDLKARFTQNQLLYTTKKVKLSGRIEGNIRAEGRFPGLTISGRMKTDHSLFSSNNVELKPFKGALSFSGKHPSYVIKDVSVSVPSARGRLGKREFLVDEIGLQIKKGQLDGVNNTIFLPEIQLNSSLLRNLIASLQVEGGNVTVRVRGEQTGLLKAALVLRLLPSGWKFSGRDSVQIDAQLDDEKNWSFKSKLTFQDLDFQNQDSNCMGEKVSLRAEVNGKIVPSTYAINTTISVQADAGEILYDRFYFDLKENPFISFYKGRYDSTSRYLQLSDLRLGFKDILTLQIRGNFLEKNHNRRFDLSINFPKTPLKPVFDHIILEPFKTEKPVLETIRIGGAVSADLKLTGTESDWMTKGYLMWQEGEFSSQNAGISLTGIDLTLPLWYQNHKGKTFSEKLKGKLLIQSMGLSFFPEQSLILRFDAQPNLLSLDTPTTLAVPGGDVQIGPVVIRELSDLSPSADTSLTIGRIELAPLLAGVWTHPMRGTISGKLDRIHFEKGTLRSIGEAKAKVFGGEVILSDLSAWGLFGAAPIFKLSARFKDLNLAELTSGTSFGKIEGVLSGHVKDLEISHGQPQRFDLLLETTKKKGVSQKISVKAVDNIAQLGSGQTPFTGVAGLFASFFKEFPYKKIGVHAILENDVFKINGTIKEGGKEYLVKRGLFSGVNVINQNPDNRVSFKDMIKRIKRVTKSRNGPIIK